MNEKELNPIAGNLKINPDLEIKLLQQMLLIRRFEEKSAEMYTKGKIRGFLHLYIGEEAVSVGVMNSLSADDNVLTTYREHGHALVRGIESKVIMAEMYGKIEGCSRGRGGSMHIFDAKKNFFGGNAIVAGHLPMAVGLALADKKMKRRQITCCFFGEGAIAEGEFHEAMNLAALWKVPVLFICENNLYAMGTAIRYTHSETDLEKKALAYGMKTSSVDGMDVLSVLKRSTEATEWIKKNEAPYFMICNTYRFRAHSMFDAELYRTKEEVEEWKKKDPISKLANELIGKNLITENQIKEIESIIEKEIQDAVDYAENGAWESIEQMQQFVYSPKNKI